eukprot:2360941-Amphidinium_carterae.4
MTSSLNSMWRLISDDRKNFTSDAVQANLDSLEYRLGPAWINRQTGHTCPRCLDELSQGSHPKTTQPLRVPKLVDGSLLTVSWGVFTWGLNRQNMGQDLPFTSFCADKI